MGSPGPPTACQRHSHLRWAAGKEVAPGCAVLLVLKLNGDVLLLGAPLVHLGDLADVPAVVGDGEATGAKSWRCTGHNRGKTADV